MTTTDADLEPFWRAIDAAPGDLLPVAGLADYLAERGHPWAEPLAWCRDTGRVPCRSNVGSRGWSRRGSVGYGPETATGNALWPYIEATWYVADERVSRSYKRLCEAWEAAVAAGTDPTAP